MAYRLMLEVSISQETFAPYFLILPRGGLRLSHL